METNIITLPNGGAGRRRPGITVVTSNNIPIPQGIQKLNTTRVMYTINTNTMHLSEAEVEAYAAHFYDMIITLHEDIEESEQVFGSERYVDWEFTTDPAVEIGGRFHRTHVHFNLTLKHALPKYSIRKLNQRFKDYIDNFPVPDGMQPVSHAIYAKLSGYQDNYANKEQRWAANVNAPTDAEAQRLSEDDTIVTREASAVLGEPKHQMFARNHSVFLGPIPGIRKYNYM